MAASLFRSSADSSPSIPQSTDVFIYVGEALENTIGQATRTKSHPKKQVLLPSSEVPKDLVKVLIHPSVKIIPNGTFSKCERLQEIQFGFSNNSSIGKQNGSCCALEVIGESAFSRCISLKNVALPKSLKWIRKSAFEGCLTLMSVELCHGLARIDDRAFGDCYGLKNVAIPDTVELVGESVFTIRKYPATFDDEEDATISNGNENNASEDPMLHPDYDDYMDEEDISQMIEDISQSDGSKTTDSFGMTPLHLVACSACPNPKLVRVILDRVYSGSNNKKKKKNNYYTKNDEYSVLTKDSWGNYPIHYAVRCNAPIEVVELLIDAQLANHTPDDTKDDNKELPLHLRHRRKEPPYWKGLLDLACKSASLPLTKFLIEASVKDRIDALPCLAWKENVRSMIFSYQEDQDEDKPDLRNDPENKKENRPQPKQQLTAPQSRLQLTKAVEKRLEWYKFQEQLSLLELSVWKANLSSTSDDSDRNMEENQRNRENCRIHCGAEFVTIYVLDFLGNFEDQHKAAKKKRKQSIPLLPTPNPWATVPALRYL
ncbi:MAG: hypothetical protein SGBAC_011155 [Bacillariaceae sp.]